jgi:hypothetical protein
LLTGPVRRAYDSWMAVSKEDRRTALDAAALVGFTRRPGKDTERNQCQDLTLSGSPFPASSSNVSPLTVTQVAEMGAEEPAEVPEETPPQDRAAMAGRDVGLDGGNHAGAHTQPQEVPRGPGGGYVA